MHLARPVEKKNWTAYRRSFEILSQVFLHATTNKYKNIGKITTEATAQGLEIVF